MLGLTKLFVLLSSVLGLHHNVTFKKLTSEADIKECKQEKVFLAFLSESCYACKMAKGHIFSEEFAPSKEITILYTFFNDSPSDFASGIAKEHKLAAIPTLICMDKNLKKIDSITGFNKNSFNYFFEKQLENK